MLKFVIVSLRVRNGGTIVAHEFCKELCRQGYDARMFYSNIFNGPTTSIPIYWTKWVLSNAKNTAIRVFDWIMGIEEDNHFCWDIRLENNKKLPIKRLPFVDDDTVVVYTDVYYGNILKAKNVVHWFMNYNRFKGDINAVGKNDLVYTYRDQYWDPVINPEHRMLGFSVFNLDLYKRTNYGTRSGKCYILRKGKSRSDLPDRFDGVIIDDLPEREKVRVFNGSEYCISYDTETGYCLIAALCGCIPVIIPEPGKTREDYYKETDMSDIDYIAWGTTDSELERAKGCLDSAEKTARRLAADIRNKVEGFVYDCEDHFKP